MHFLQPVSPIVSHKHITPKTSSHCTKLPYISQRPYLWRAPEIPEPPIHALGKVMTKNCVYIEQSIKAHQYRELNSPTSDQSEELTS